MLNDPRTKARTFLESSSIVSELENVLNHLVYEKPDDLHGFLANHFLHQSKQPQIATLSLRRLIGPAGEPSVHIDLTIALRNHTERHHGLTVNLSSNKTSPQTVKQLEELVSSTALKNVLNRVDLYDQVTLDDHLADFRAERANEMAKLSAVESEIPTGESTPEVSLSKVPSSKRGAASPGVVKGNPPPPVSSKKGTGKDAQPVEILPDELEPASFAGQSLITGISLTCRLITAEMQQTNLYRLLQLPSLTRLSMPLPIIPILQSGLVYPGKQSLIKYFMLIPTPETVHNEAWLHKVHHIVQFLRDSISTIKGAILQSSYSTDDGCLVIPMDKPEQGFDLLQNAVNTVCGTEEQWFNYAVQMGPYETFDYTRNRYETMTSVIKSPEELVDVYTEWIDAYPRCIMLIDPFRHADKPALARLCDRLSNRCYITSTDSRRYQDNEDNNTINCHLLNLDRAPTITELIHRVNTLRENNASALGLFERDHQEVAQVHIADLAVGLGCRFVKLPGILSLGGQRTSSIIQRLALIRDEIDMTNDEQFARPQSHQFVHIRSSLDLNESNGPTAANPPANKTKDNKKKRP